MRKLSFVLIALLALTSTMRAQQYVSTEPANRNVVIEDFSGRGCGYCTQGHAISNQIMADNPGRVWTVDIHAGYYAETTYPNMRTSDGTAIHDGFTITGYPQAVINRSTAAALNRDSWNEVANQQLGQAAECNIAGVATVNPYTRVATITVEVYYTGNSAADENYLTIAMLQDSILGSQSDYGDFNPTQWIDDDTYCHMHILRDVITPTWGDPIAPTSQGTLITKTYEYRVPEKIGDPNGVEVVLDHISFLAWVSERTQDTPTRPILNACELSHVLTDVDSHFEGRLNVYPNPANSVISIDGVDVSLVEVYNAVGQKVASVEGSENTQVDVASFANGVYVVKVVTTDGKVAVRKVTIAH